MLIFLFIVILKYYRFISSQCYLTFVKIVINLFVFDLCLCRTMFHIFFGVIICFLFFLLSQFYIMGIFYRLANFIRCIFCKIYVCNLFMLARNSIIDRLNTFLQLLIIFLLIIHFLSFLFLLDFLFSSLYSFFLFFYRFFSQLLNFNLFLQFFHSLFFLLVFLSDILLSLFNFWLI